MTRHSILHTPEGASLAYHYTNGLTPGVVFLHGLGSDMTGDKALTLENWCQRHNRSFLRLDQQGHGSSSGGLESWRISVWVRDTIFAMEKLMPGPSVLVGSSMGGWMMLLIARQRPDLVAGLVGIAAAPDFTTVLKRDNPEVAPFFDEGGYFHVPGGPPGLAPLRLSPDFIRDGNENAFFNAPFFLKAPVRLIQGQRDESVPWQTALHIQDHMENTDVHVTLIKDGEHRLSRPADLRLLEKTISLILENT